MIPVWPWNGLKQGNNAAAAMAWQYSVKTTWATALAWTLAVCGSLAWDIQHERARIMQQAHAEARANYDKDITFRRWASAQGGVYVPRATLQTLAPGSIPPPRVDVETTDGRKFTLLEPDVMVQQLMQRYALESGIRGRMTGLRQINPANAPDAWEKAQLESFTKGEREEVWDTTKIDGRPFLRYLHALFMAPECEKCHGGLGYKPGEMRGAIGVNLPLDKYLQSIRAASINLGLSHVGIWLLGLFGIFRAGQQMGRRFQERQALVDAFKASEERFNLAVQGAQDGVWDTDLVSGNTYHSPRMSEMLGYAPNELPSKVEEWKVLVHPEDYAKATAALQAHVRGETPRYEAVMRIRAKDRSWHWILTRGQAIRDAANNALRILGTHTDITERKAMEEQLYAEKERAQVTLSSIADAVITTDTEGNVTFMNPVAETLTGWGMDKAQGMPVETVAMVMDEETRAPMAHPVSQCRSQGKVVGLPADAYLLKRDGGEIAIQVSAAPILDQEGHLKGVVMVFHDVTQSRSLARQMSWQIKHDALTGLISRREFERRLDELVQDAQAGGVSHALLYMDLDNFKIVNDTCGHVAGDELLKQLAFLLAEQMRKNDTLARLGGDEFGALLENCPLEKTQLIAEKLLRTVGDFRFVWGNRSFDVGVSIGVVMIDAATANATEALSAADIACYAAKEEGRNRVHVYLEDGAERHRQQREMFLAGDLRAAIEGKRFVLFAQEIRSLKGKPGRYFEVLMRMQNEHGELMSPGAFVPAAERFGLMKDIDRWVVGQTLAMLGVAGEEAADIRLAINLSGLSLQDPEMPGFIKQALAQSGVDPARLTFEITETAAVAQLSTGVRFMRECESSGCRFALDDFGSGMSSFAYLKALPVQVLKIDGAFVRDLLSDRADRAFVEAIHNVARTLGMETVAEFAETPELIAALEEIGVDYAQGYAVAKPRALEMILAGV
jgi:diguanylate cyclase (GGDEF)-like protein/PAS domain S-box-containing protein